MFQVSRRRQTFWLGCVFLFSSLTGISAQSPLDTEGFLYQGVLRVDGELINGTRDLRFAIYDSTDPLASELAAVEQLAVTVQNGIVNAKLDFSVPHLFNGSARWLDSFTPWP